MHRDPLRKLLNAYAEVYPDEKATAERIGSLVEAHPNCFDRDCLPGHITGSSWIVSHDHSKVLLTHHRKLDLWLQLGGHADGEPDVLRTSLREAREESGMSNFRVELIRGLAIPLDLDVHTIPAYGDAPAHEHHDVRYLLVAEPDQPLVMSSESKDLRWFENDEVESVGVDESVLRMHRKATALFA